MNDRIGTSLPLLTGDTVARANRRVPAAMGSRIQRETIWLIVALFLSCMILARFVIPLGGSATSVVGPVGFAIAGVGLARGLLTFDRRRVMIYFGLVGLVLISAAVNAMVSNPFAISTSWMSTLQFLALSAFATLTFARPLDEDQFFRAVNGCFAFIAITGLIQFVAQFGGVAVFRFSDVIPGRFLTELFTGGGYSNEIPINSGEWFKSNGFFLAEPSIFSQFMAVAIAIETLYFRRLVFFGLYIAALLASVSGTGWIALGVFVATTGVSMGRRGVMIAVSLSIGVGLALILWAVTLPDVFSTFIGRYDEIFSVGTSAQIRFVTPFWISKEILDRVPWALLLGVGSSVSERIWIPYEGGINTPIKIALEYGIPVLMCYALLVSFGRHAARQRRLLPALLTLLALTGGYSQFPPVLFPILLIVPVASLTSLRMPRRTRSG